MPVLASEMMLSKWHSCGIDENASSPEVWVKAAWSKSLSGPLELLLQICCLFLFDDTYRLSAKQWVSTKPSLNFDICIIFSNVIGLLAG